MTKNTEKVVGTIVNNEILRDKIYNIRGYKVMLDYDLAEIYGYTTKAFNQQVKNNIEKFEGEDFMFRLTHEELVEFLRSNFLTLKTGRGEHYKYLPYAFTEQGIYMLMTVLRGELAVTQSRALIRLFKAMKDYITENRFLLDQREQLKMMALVAENSKSLGKVEEEITLMNNRIADAEAKLDNTIMRNEISPIMLDFNKFVETHEYLLMNGEPAKAVEVYQEIYSKAKKSLYIIDDYIDMKTLRLLAKAKSGVEIIVFSDNIGHYLHKNDFEDFKREFPDANIRFVKTCKVMHDRFIVVDYGVKGEVIYHCGASSKDAGKAVTVVSELQGELTKRSMEMVVELLKRNPDLKLK
ncbi:ORF6N domain-containing protein [Candidatus Saccharibacteria bacterium]|nr:ORF6N domain-containing protein [Candidatus Saccharibacteria bacterium]